MEKTAEILLPSADATARLAVAIGANLNGGDVILLSGDVGAGKTHFARSLIQSRLAEPEDVPSPTFTLVQVYDAPEVEIWHSDLYRLSGPDQVFELGLADAFETAVCLVEWPDRLGDLTPSSALSATFTDGDNDDARVAHFSWTDSRWDDLMQQVTA